MNASPQPGSASHPSELASGRASMPRAVGIKGRFFGTSTRIASAAQTFIDRAPALSRANYGSTVCSSCLRNTSVRS